MIPVRPELLTMEECRHTIGSILGGMAQAWGTDMVRAAVSCLLIARGVASDVPRLDEHDHANMSACAAILGALCGGLSAMATEENITGAWVSLAQNDFFWLTIASLAKQPKGRNLS
jgi:hypothetical protein